MTAHGGGELGCFTQARSKTALALPTGGVVAVQNVMLGVHGVLVAWASSDLSMLPAMPASSTTGPAQPPSTERSTSSPASISTRPNHTSTATVTITPLITITTSTTRSAESITRSAEPHVNQPAGDAAPVPENGLSTTTSPVPPAPSAATIPSPTPLPPQSLPPRVIAGISIGAAAGVVMLGGLIILAVLIRRRHRAKTYGKGNGNVDVRVFETASQFHEDKRRWSQLSSSFGTASGSGQQLDVDVSEADSRAVVVPIAELGGGGLRVCVAAGWGWVESWSGNLGSWSHSLGCR